ncbi:hypothetical protein [Edaphobacter aggregans]|uniref:hypothetical protein n=1 Tax=Edaphobacter aggregans TaxID=570835 RepID=UPI00054F7E33|nr:hypothetical protein [Edaphobacter aggregans]
MNPAVSYARNHLPALVILAGILALFFSFFVSQYSNRVGHDQTTCLFEAQRFLGGDEIYGPRLSETNPPVIIWFSAVPLLLAQGLHLAPGAVFRVIVAAMVLVATLWCTSIVYRTRSSAITNAFSLGLLGCFTVMVLFAVGGYDFGQREHLVVILLLPYLLASTAPDPSRLLLWERCVIGTCAGLAVWLKPHFILVVLAFEFLRAIQTRSFRRILSPQIISFAATGILILLLVLVATPRYRTRTLPLLFDTYWGLGTSTTLALAVNSSVYLLLIGILFIAWYLLRRRLCDPATSSGLLLASFAAFIAYDLQHTDWQYHRYPYRAFLLLAITWLGIDLLSPYFGRLSRARRLTGLSAAALLLCGLSGPLNAKLPNHVYTEVDPVFSRLPPSTTVYAISTGVVPLASAYYFHLDWGGRFAHLWLIPAILQNETGAKNPSAPFKRLPPETVAYLADLQRRETTEDLNRWRPKVVLVERCRVESTCQGLEGKNIDLLAWFERSPAFAAAWSQYRRQPSTLERFDVYTLAP